VRSHLKWRSETEGRDRAESERAKELLARPDIKKLITEECASGDLSKAAELGAMLADIGGDPDEVVSKVTSRLALRTSSAFEEWFDKLPDIDSQCLAISVAVFNGEAYETVATLAVQLHRRSQTPEGSRFAPIPVTRKKRLEQLHCMLVPAPVNTRHGGAPPGLIVRFQDPGVPAQVLGYAWDELDGMRSQLVKWLRGCVRSESPTVRVRAAVAVGVLAARSFDTIRAEIITQWATDKSSVLRDAAAVALDTAVREEPRLAKAIQNLVNSWQRADLSALRATAARSWRTRLSVQGSAARMLSELALTDDLDVLEAICVTVAEFFASNEDERIKEILSLLTAWLRSRNRQHVLVGELSFLYAAADLIERRPVIGSEGGATVWPALLAFSARDPMQQHDVALLWGQVLGSSETYEAAQSVLFEWAYTVEPVPAGQRALGRLMFAAATSVRLTRIIRYQANVWASAREGRTAPEASAAVLAHLAER
jgi:hypothetical protein